MTTVPPPKRHLRLVAAALMIGLVGSTGCAEDQSSTAASASTPAPTTSTSPSTSIEPAVDEVVRLLDVDEFETLLENNSEAPVINVHIPYEGHIDGTDHFVAFDEIAEWDGLPVDLDAPIILYCRSGNMSATASQTLADMGYTDITDLEGGMNAWTEAGNHLLDEEPESES